MWQAEGLTETFRRFADARRRAAEFVAEAAREGPVLVLAEVRAAADEVALAACGNALLDVHRRSFRDLVTEFASPELNRRGLVPVGRFVREALAARITAEAMGKSELRYLAPVAAFPGFPRALTSTFEELRLNGVTPESLRTCGASGPDLANLLAAYERELAERGFADHAQRVRLALGRSELPPWAIVAVDLAPRTKLERDLLAKVMASARAALVLRPGQTEAAPATSLDSLQQALFSEEAVAVREEDDTVAIFSTSGEALECVEIARRIHAAAGRGVPFDEIAILLRSPERHQPLVAEALRRAGIPAVFAEGLLRPDAAGRSFLALLCCAQENLSASRFAEYLSLGQMSEGEEPHTPIQWERRLVDAAVIGSKERWETRLRGLREELHRRFAGEPEEELREVLERRIASVENLERLALPVIGKLAALPRRASWGEWIAALIELAEFTLRDAGTRRGRARSARPDGRDRARGARRSPARDAAAPQFAADRAEGRALRQGVGWRNRREPRHGVPRGLSAGRE